MNSLSLFTKLAHNLAKNLRASVQRTQRLLVTTALLYANGPVHLGHLLEQIQADIWVRFQKLQGNECLFIGGEDAHGTPIMLAADAKGITPTRLVQEIFSEHQRDLGAFSIGFDHFGTTHSSENEALVASIYKKLQAQGAVKTRFVEQAFDAEKKMFLPDRYVKGTCPQCDTQDQYGDNCEHCGGTYNALDLKDPISVLSGSSPIAKSCEQYFLQLSLYQDFLKAWVQEARLPIPALHKLLEWFNQQATLKDLAISREAPYFGFKIPGVQDKYFYVWVDAPIGYIAIFKELCKQKPQLHFNRYWDLQTDTELYHFIGKDIVKFHALFWPAMLKGAEFRLPTRLFVHGYLTIEGRKMSKSRGTFITAEQYLRHLNPDYLRYYFASKLNDTIQDIDLNWSDFMQKINADCVGKFINIASRCAKLLHTYFDNQLSQTLEDDTLFKRFVEAGDEIAEKFKTQKYNQAVTQILGLADETNLYLAQQQPWNLVNEDVTRHRAQQVCTTGLNLFRIIATYLKPILPTTTDKIAVFLNLNDLNWHERCTPLLNSKVQPYQPLLQRVTPSAINALLQ